MGVFYNRGTGALPLALPGGKSASVPGKRTIELTAEEAGCESVQRAVRSKVLIVLPTGETAAPDAAPAASGGFAPFVAVEPPAETPSAAPPPPPEAGPVEEPPAELGERPSRVSRERTSSKQRVG